MTTAALPHTAKAPADAPLAAVRIRGVEKYFGTGENRVAALRGVDWDVEAGQMSLLVGPSGCGKTTLLSVIAGILDCDAGERRDLRRRRLRDGRRPENEISRQEHRLRLPAIQPAAGADRRGKRGDSRS